MWVLGATYSNGNCSGDQLVSCRVSLNKSQSVSWPQYNCGVIRTKSWHFYGDYNLKELFACWVAITLHVSSEVWFKQLQLGTQNKVSTNRLQTKYSIMSICTKVRRLLCALVSFFLLRLTFPELIHMNHQVEGLHQSWDIVTVVALCRAITRNTGMLSLRKKFERKTT